MERTGVFEGTEQCSTTQQWSMYCIVQCSPVQYSTAQYKDQDRVEDARSLKRLRFWSKWVVLLVVQCTIVPSELAVEIQHELAVEWR